MTTLLHKDETFTTSQLVESLLAQAKRTASKPKKEAVEEDIDDEEESPKKGARSTKKDEDDNDEDNVDVKDDWEKGEEEDGWDPDFEEFDLPKSKKGKAGKESEDEDVKIEEDEEFKDLFANDGSIDEEEDF